MGDLDIGFALLPAYEGKGYALESSQAIITQAIKTFGVKKINGYTNQTNLASQKLLKKLGLKCIGTMTFPNETEELFWFQTQIDE